MKPTVALIAGVVALVAILVAGLVFLSQGLTEGARLIIINAMIGGTFTVIASLMALAKIEKVHNELKNGLLGDAMNKMAADPGQRSVTFNSDREPTHED